MATEIVKFFTILHILYGRALISLSFQPVFTGKPAFRRLLLSLYRLALSPGS